MFKVCQGCQETSKKKIQLGQGCKKKNRKNELNIVSLCCSMTWVRYLHCGQCSHCTALHKCTVSKCFLFIKKKHLDTPTVCGVRLSLKINNKHYELVIIETFIKLQTLHYFEH